MENIKEILSYLEKNKENIELSKFEGDIFWLSDVVYKSVADGNGFKSVLIYPGDDKRRYWLILDWSNAEEKIKQLYDKAEKNPEKIKEEFYSVKNKLLKISKKEIEPLNMDMKKYKEYSQIIGKAGLISTTSFEFIEKILSKKITDSFKDEKLRVLLTTPLYKSYVQEEEEALIKIIEKLPKKEKEMLEEGLKNVEDYPAFKKEIEKHIEKWGWAYFNYATHKAVSYEVTFDKIRDLYANLNKEKSRLNELESKRIEKRIALKSLKENQKKLILLLDAITELRDQRKAMWLSMIIAAKNYLKDLAKCYNLDFDKLRWLTFDEQIDFKNNEKKYRQIIEERERGFVAIYGVNSKSRILFTGNEAQQIIEAVFKRKTENELKGTIACSGKVQGQIKNIINKDDFSKFKHSEILCASHTTPDYVPIMKRAKAILTERGGITCHAAIVSRELGIPCIVGIKGLVGNFKDGDLVEVDANKGIVKIIKKA